MATRSHPESARIIREARQAAGLTQLELFVDFLIE